jgi:hypothetical protein
MGGEPSIYKRMDGGTWAQAGRELNTLDRQARVRRVPTAAASAGLAAHNGKRACLPLHERAQTLQYAVLFLAPKSTSLLPREVLVCLTRAIVPAPVIRRVTHRRSALSRRAASDCLIRAVKR